MAVRKVALMGNPILLKPARSVDDPTAPEIAHLARDMQDTIEECGANGIAGPQVYSDASIVVFRFAKGRIPPGSSLNPVPWTVMINPVLTLIDEPDDLYWERCLSIPNLHGKVPRSSLIGLTYQTLDGKNEEREARSWDAVLMQHEVDHLHGTLFTMRMTDMSTLSFNSAPGILAEDAKTDKDIDPLLIDMVESWPMRERWSGYLEQ